MQHDTPGELAQPLDVKEWSKGQVAPIPGKTMASISVIERDYPNVYKRFTALGPLMSSVGNGGKGIAWETQPEIELLGKLNGIVTEEGQTKGLPRIETDIDATEVILSLAPETNGEVAMKAWNALSEFTGREHAISPRPRKTRRSAFAISRPSHARSSRRPPGPESSRKRSVTTPATPMCTN